MHLRMRCIYTMERIRVIMKIASSSNRDCIQIDDSIYIMSRLVTNSNFSICCRRNGRDHYLLNIIRFTSMNINSFYSSYFRSNVYSISVSVFSNVMIATIHSVHLFVRIPDSSRLPSVVIHTERDDHTLSLAHYRTTTTAALLSLVDRLHSLFSS